MLGQNEETEREVLNHTQFRFSCSGVKIERQTFTIHFVSTGELLYNSLADVNFHNHNPTVSYKIQPYE